MGHRTPLFEHHQKLNAKIVDFAGWDMPLHYGSQINEHHQVRQDAGMFDVSHMTIVDVKGEGARDFLRYLLANDIDKLKIEGKALYSCMLNEKGGVVDDLIIYFIQPNFYRLVVNSATREKDLAWIKKQAEKFSVTLKLREDLAILAVQGPQAREKVSLVLTPEQRGMIEKLAVFQAGVSGEWLIARTGYTGEDGLEIMLPIKDAIQLWEKLLEVGVVPCGLGARDTLRLEAGMNLYGADMDEQTSPLESNLAWTVVLDPADRDFIGRKALESQKQQGLKQKLVGLVLEERGVLRNHQKVIVSDVGEGEVTSGSFSPTLNQAIAMARVPLSTGERCFVMIRENQVPARVIKPPFVRNGKKAFT